MTVESVVQTRCPRFPEEPAGEIAMKTSTGSWDSRKLLWLGVVTLFALRRSMAG